ncbi:hypothetical protein MTR67_001107 [Solanum verrucosum]|uniref:Uncharacterized protein n=1 Tax=Solanum verrucosum TaxID=315347 RepID=A0AAF0PN07_SOLVR|nr:hypothetical protein MTR67_001107 [Solanum verrucosum]
MDGGMGLHLCIAQVNFESKHVVQLAYSYILCTDASWPASYYDADAGTQDQDPARRWSS